MAGTRCFRVHGGGGEDGWSAMLGELGAKAWNASTTLGTNKDTSVSVVNSPSHADEAGSCRSYT